MNESHWPLALVVAAVVVGGVALIIFVALVVASLPS